MSNLTQHNTVTEIVRLYEAAEADIREAFAIIDGAEKRLNHALVNNGAPGYQYGSFRVEDCSGHHPTWSMPDDSLYQLRRQMWRHIVDRLELRRMMSAKRWRELEKQLGRTYHFHQADPLPEITVENVMRFASTYQQQIPEMATEAVREVFDWLRPPGSHYKTNSEYEVPPKVIIRCIDPTWCAPRRFRVGYHFTQNIQSMENVFRALDGGGHVSPHHRSDLENAIAATEDGTGETDLFRFRCFRNGNLHLWFKRLDLLKRFNMMAGGKRLRGTEAA